MKPPPQLRRLTAAIAEAWQRIGPHDARRAMAWLVATALICYAWEGWRTTVIVELVIPPDLAKDLPGIDATTLTHELIGELASIRSAQATATQVNFNLVKGIPTLAEGQDRLAV